MRFLLADDEKFSLKNLERTMRRAYPDAEIICADNYKEILKHEGEEFTAVFLDIEMPGMNGVEVAQRLAASNPKLNIIFITAYDDYALDAYKLHASGYILKPYDIDNIKEEMSKLRYPVEAAQLQIRCFGNFDVFYNKKSVRFERSNAKEIFAYLISLNGASATKDEICSILWENSVDVERRKDYFRTLIRSLKNTLKSCGAEEALDCGRNSYRVDPDMLDCDYFHYLRGEKKDEIRFYGEFMKQYSWAEDVVGLLIEEK